MGLRSLDVPIYTVCQGQAYSAAAIILSIGSPGCRFASPNSTVMLHPWSFDLPEDAISQQRKTTEFFSEQCDKINEIIGENCRKSTKAKYRKLVDEIAQTVWLNANDAIKYGIIDGLWNFQWEIEEGEND